MLSILKVSILVCILANVCICSQLAVSTQISEQVLTTPLSMISPYPYRPCVRESSSEEVEEAEELYEEIYSSSSYAAAISSNQTACTTPGRRKREKMYKDLKRSKKRNDPPPPNVPDFSGYPAGTNGTFSYAIARRDPHVQSNSLCMCSSYLYQVTLPERYYPRHHSHVSCTEPDGSAACLMGEGTCVVATLPVVVRYDVNNVGMAHIDEWAQIEMLIPKICVCQVLQGSIFEDFV